MFYDYCYFLFETLHVYHDLHFTFTLVKTRTLFVVHSLSLSVSRFGKDDDALIKNATA